MLQYDRSAQMCLPAPVSLNALHGQRSHIRLVPFFPKAAPTMTLTDDSVRYRPCAVSADLDCTDAEGIIAVARVFRICLFRRLVQVVLRAALAANVPGCDGADQDLALV